MLGEMKGIIQDGRWPQLAHLGLQVNMYTHIGISLEDSEEKAMWRTLLTNSKHEIVL